jgi:dihydrofolate synthase/folylpolyglutamate synthase
VTYDEMEAELFARARGGMKLGLDRMERALAELGRPDRCAPSVHVAGTNGKGSVCAMLDAAGRAAGIRTGLYTSPHLERFTERFRVGGEPVAEDVLVALYVELRGRLPWAFDGPDALTFFELVTLLAFQHFARAHVELMVVEVGLGGRLDATNVIRPLVSCITPIGFDHREFLGDTLAQIAGEKAGILKPGVPAVVSRQPPDALSTILERARLVGSPLFLEGRDFSLDAGAADLTFRSTEASIDGLSLGLPGAHQRSNAAVALRAMEVLRASGVALTATAAREGLSSVQWPGRLERVSRAPDVFLDGAHNPPAAVALAAACQELFAGRRIHLVMGVLADKELAPMLETLARVATRLIATAPASPRALPAARLAERVPRGVLTEVFESAAAAVRHAIDTAGPDDVVLVCGSLYLVGEVRARDPHGSVPR